MGLKNVLSKFKFCYSISANLVSAGKLIYDTKRFNRIYQAKKYKNSPSQFQNYQFNFSGKRSPVRMRLFNGDLNMLYEVLWSQTYQLPASIIRDPENILDFGANIGFASIYFAVQYPQARIIAVEPSRQNFELLQFNTASFTQIIPVHAAVYPRPGNISFLDDDLAYNSRIGTQEGKSYEVRAITVQEIMREHHIKTVDLLKLDIEGAEQILLSENTDWLNNVTCIIVELHQPYSVTEFIEHLKPYHFEVLIPEQSGIKMIVAIKHK